MATPKHALGLPGLAACRFSLLLWLSGVHGGMHMMPLPCCQPCSASWQQLKKVNELLTGCWLPANDTHRGVEPSHSITLQMCGL